MPRKIESKERKNKDDIMQDLEILGGQKKELRRNKTRYKVTSSQDAENLSGQFYFFFYIAVCPKRL